MAETSLPPPRPALGVVRRGYVGPGRLAFGMTIALGALALVSAVLGRPPALPETPPLARRGRRSVRRPFDRTLEALADTIVPAGDGAPGAREAGGVDVLRLASMGGLVQVPIGLYAAWVAIATDAAAILTAGRRFHRLALDRRVALFERLLDRFPSLYGPVLIASGLAFAGGAVTDEGPAWLGLPGPVKRLAPGEGADFEPRHATASGNLP